MGTSADEVFFDGSEIVQKLHGKFDIVFASSLFHMWDWNTQFEVAGVDLLISVVKDRVS